MAGGGYWVRRISSSISLIFSLTPMVEYYSVLLCVGGVYVGLWGALWGINLVMVVAVVVVVVVGMLRLGRVAGLRSAGLTNREAKQNKTNHPTQVRESAETPQSSSFK